MKLEAIRKKLDEQYYTPLYNAAKDFLQDFYNRPAEPISFNISQVDLYMGYDRTIKADAEIQLSWSDYSGEYDLYRGDETFEKLVIPCTLYPEKGETRIKIGQPCFFNSYTKSGIELTKNWRPKVNPKHYETIVFGILQAICPEVFSDPQPVPIERIISELGIPVEVRKGLYENESAIGKTVFNGKGTYDRTGRYISGATIYIDEDLYLSSNIGRLRFTLAHELGHVILHEEYFRGQDDVDKPPSNNAFSSSQDHCAGEEDNTDYELRESQANGFAACLLMPKDPFLKKYYEFKDGPQADYPFASESVNIAFLETAEFFQVSREAAKYRLRNLGVSEVDGVNNFIYVNNKREGVPNYAFATGALKPWETFFISFEDFLKVACADKKLFKLVVEDKIVYVDGHLVLNDKKYVKNVEGRKKLTIYALESLDECAYIFKKEKIKFAGQYKNTGRIRYRNQNTKITCSSALHRLKIVSSKFTIEVEDLAFASEEQKAVAPVLARMRGKGFSIAFYEALKWHDEYVRGIDSVEHDDPSNESDEGVKYAIREDGSVNYRAAGEILGMDGKTVKRYVEGGRPQTLLEVLEIADNLCLTSDLILELISEFDYDLRTSNRLKDQRLAVILKYTADQGLTEWKKYMAELGSPLE